MDELNVVYDGPDAKGWYAATLPDVPGANGQGKTREEARESVIEAAHDLLTLRTQDSRKPTRKIAAVGITGAVGTVIAYALGVDEETAGAMATLVVLIVGAGYGTRDRS